MPKDKSKSSHAKITTTLRSHAEVSQALEDITRLAMTMDIADVNGDREMVAVVSTLMWLLGREADAPINVAKQLERVRELLRAQLN